MHLTIVFATADRSLMAKKADGIKESTDSNTTIEEEETRGKHKGLIWGHLKFLLYLNFLELHLILRGLNLCWFHEH